MKRFIKYMIKPNRAKCSTGIGEREGRRMERSEDGGKNAEGRELKVGAAWHLLEVFR